MISKNYFKLLVIFFLSLSFFVVTQKAHASATLQKIRVNNLGLVGYWTLDGADTPWTSATAGTATDRSGSSLDGTLTNMSQVANPAQGKIGQALTFDGANDYIARTFSSTLAPTTLSYSVWIKPSSFPNQYAWIGAMLTDSDADAGDWAVGLCFSAAVCGGGAGSGNIVAWNWNGSGGSYLWTFTQNIIPLNAWTHIVVTRSTLGSEPTVYVNGVLMSATSGPNASGGGWPTGLEIGRADPSDTNYFYKGLIDEVRIYSRALTAAQVLALYRSGAARANASSATLDDGGTLESGLVGLWTLDGNDTNWGSNTTLDQSGSGNTGTITNMSTTTSPTDGKLGQALSFDGVNDQVLNTSDPAVLNFGTGDFSVSAWMYPTGAANFVTPIGFRTIGGSNGWGIEDIGTLDWVDFALALNVRARSTTFTRNTWHHVVALRRGSTLSIYVDGVKGSDNTDASDVNNADRLSFGSAEYKGRIDEVRIYNRALSTSEIGQLYRLGQAKINSSQNITGGSLDTGLVGLWSFNGADINWTSATAGTATDRSGQGNTGTLTNMSRATSPTIGKVGQALSFDGSNDYVDAGNGSSLNLSGSITVSVWAKNNNTSNQTTTLIGKTKPTSAFNGWTIGFGANSQQSASGNKFIAYYRTSSIVDRGEISNNSVLDTNWHHWVAVFNQTADSVTLYEDGVAIPQTQDFNHGSWPDPTTTTNLVIGAYADNTLNFNGSIDEARVYNRALSADEVKQLYNMGR